MEKKSNSVKPEITYSVPVTEPKQGESAIYRKPENKTNLLSNEDLKIQNLGELFQNVSFTIII